MIEQIKQLVKDKSDPELHVSERMAVLRELQTCGPEYVVYLIGEVERLNNQIYAEVKRHVDNEWELKQDRDLHQRVCMKEMEKVNELQKALEEAYYIMKFHTMRCPMDIMNNFSGSEEHLAGYRAVMNKLQALKKGE